MSAPTALRILKRTVQVLAMAFLAPVALAVAWYFAASDGPVDWRTARSDSTGQAPSAENTPDAVIQVYAARAFRWRGAFGVHTWVATKHTGADHYVRYEVMGFGLRQGGGAVRIHPSIPDAYWYGKRPQLLRDLRGGTEVDDLIDRIDALARSYPYDDRYRLWPGPNSNTFVAYLARALPELALDLPPTAIGKDFLPGGAWLAAAPSGRGYQLSLGGLLGLIAAPEEGVELNLLGLAIGLDFSPPALKLPGLGRIGPSPDPFATGVSTRSGSLFGS
ncbi:MAG: DUF3750 domain-containing protein [Rhodocyclaceae bacterium]|nr:DUF3750 domain-containing protein [Rhodocyclaceae bacterium]